MPTPFGQSVLLQSQLDPMTHKLIHQGALLIGTSGLADSAVTSAKILDGTITLTDLAASLVSLLVPVGLIAPYYGATPPTSWLVCDGTTFSAVTYPALNTLLGGNTLPNLKGRVIVGYDAAQTEFNALAKTGGLKTLTTNEMPVHSHTQNPHNHGGWVGDSAGFTPAVQNSAPPAGGTGIYLRGASPILNIPADTAVNQNSGSGAVGGNLPPYSVMNYIIRAG